MSGRGFRAASSGLRSLIDVLQANDAEKFKGEETRKRDEEREHERRMDAMMRSVSLNDAGGYVSEPGVLGSPMFQSKLGPVGAPRERNISPADLMGDMGNIRVDPMRSTRAKQQAQKDAADLAARQATAKLFTDPDEQGAVQSGASVADVRGARPPAPPVDRNPVMGSPEWKDAIRFQAQTTAQYRAPSAASRGKTLPAGQIEKLAMFSDLEAAARTIPSLIDAENGNIGTGPIMGQLPAFLRNRTNANGINARAVIASIEGQYMNLLSGAAVSPSEAARLAPFVPNQRDDEQTIKAKAIAFANRLRQIGKAKRDAFRAAGYAVGEDGEGDSTDGDNAFSDLIPPSGRR